MAVRTTCCRFRCGWWPRASFRPREERRKSGRKDKSGESRDGRGETRDKTRSGREPARGVGGGGAPPPGRENAGARATRQRGARLLPAPPPRGRGPASQPRGTELVPGAEPRGAAYGQCNDPHRGGPGRVALRGQRGGREGGETSGLRVEKGTEMTGVGGGLERAPRDAPGLREAEDTRARPPSPRLAPRSRVALTVRARSRWRSRGASVALRSGQWRALRGRPVPAAPRAAPSEARAGSGRGLASQPSRRGGREQRRRGPPSRSGCLIRTPAGRRAPGRLPQSGLSPRAGGASPRRRSRRPLEAAAVVP